MIFAERWRDPRFQRLAALAVAGLMALIVWGGIGQPLLDIAFGEHPIALRLRLLAEQRRLGERVPALRQALDELHRNQADTADFLPQAPVALAAAQMQDYVGGLIRPLNGKIASVEPLTLSDDQGFHRAGLRLKLDLQPDALPALLHRLEYGRPRLFLADLSIKAKSDDLTIVMDIFGYLPPEGS